MRVRQFELRLVGAALVVGWTIAAGLVLLAYRPGGPLDVLVGLTMAIPIAIAAAGTIWPPLARGSVAFASMVWLGIGALLCLVPSIAGLIDQLQALGSQTLLPSFEAAYPWLLALTATSLFSGFGISRHVRGPGALRRRRLADGAFIAVLLTMFSATVFAGAAMANELAVRDTVPASSRFGPTGQDEWPPLCDGPLSAGPAAHLQLDVSATVDLRPIGTVDGGGTRVGDDFRWTGYAATDQRFAQVGAARIGDDAWTREPGRPWVATPPATVADDTLDLQVLETALAAGNRVTAEDRGVDIIEGARARRCRVAVDGTTFAAAFPQIRWLTGDADLHRWRGQLDYWVFMDGELGQVAGSASGEAAGIEPETILGEVDVKLTATDRNRHLVVYPPAT